MTAIYSNALLRLLASPYRGARHLPASSTPRPNRPFGRYYPDMVLSHGGIFGQNRPPTLTPPRQIAKTPPGAPAVASRTAICPLGGVSAPRNTNARLCEPRTGLIGVSRHPLTQGGAPCRLN